MTMGSEGGERRLSREALKRLLASDPEKAAELIRKYRKATAVLARSDPDAFMEYVFKDDRTGKSVHQAPVHRALQEIAITDKRACIWAASELGKCETADAPILMADGTWRRIDSLTERCEVMALDPVTMELRKVWAGPSYANGLRGIIRFVTVTGRVVNCTHEHPLYVKGRGWVQAKDIKPHWEGNPELLVAGYTPMPWLGHGPGALSVNECSLAGFLLDASLSFASGLYHVFWPKHPVMQAELKRVVDLMGWKLGYRDNGLVQVLAPEGGDRVGDIAASFCKAANWNRLSKEFKIHDDIFRASDDAVFAFLRALFSRANVGCKARGGKTFYSVPISFVTSSFEFAHDIQLLATRLGGLLSVNVAPRPKKTRSELAVMRDAVRQSERIASKELSGSDGIDVARVQFTQRSWCVSFADAGTARLFWDRVNLPAMGVFERLYMVESLESSTGATYPRPTWALPVHDDCHCYISMGVVSHNTTQLSVGHTLWKLGRNPDSSTIVISNTKDQAQKIIGQMKGLIQNSDRLHDVFPDLKPGQKWSEFGFTVERSTERRDPSVQACGLRGNIQGARADNLLLDDIDDEESTMTPAARADTLRWVQATAFSRLGEDAQVLAVGNTWDDNDCMHSLAKLPGWNSYKFSVLNDQGESNWPDKYSHERIQQIRQDLGDLQFARMYLCEPVDAATARFRPEWIDNALAAGTGLSMLHELADIPAGCVTITGVDLGVREKKGSDPTAMVTVLHRLGTKKCELLNVEAGLWSAPEIADRIVSIHQRFLSTVFVENNAAQNFLIQIVQSLGERVPVKSFSTGRNKHDPLYGVESLAVEMSTNQWTIPTVDGSRAGCHLEIRRLLEEMIVYAPGKHTGDRLMALWIAREAGRVKQPGKASVGRFKRF